MHLVSDYTHSMWAGFPFFVLCCSKTRPQFQIKWKLRPESSSMINSIVNFIDVENTVALSNQVKKRVLHHAQCARPNSIECFTTVAIHVCHKKKMNNTHFRTYSKPFVCMCIVLLETRTKKLWKSNNDDNIDEEEEENTLKIKKGKSIYKMKNVRRRMICNRRHLSYIMCVFFILLLYVFYFIFCRSISWSPNKTTEWGSSLL